MTIFAITSSIFSRTCLASLAKFYWCISFVLYQYHGTVPPVVKCPDLPATIPFGTINDTKVNYEYGDVISYQCRLGYLLERTSTVRCTATGVWEPAARLPARCVCELNMRTKFGLPQPCLARHIVRSFLLLRSMFNVCLHIKMNTFAKWLRSKDSLCLALTSYNGVIWYEVYFVYEFTSLPVVRCGPVNPIANGRVRVLGNSFRKRAEFLCNVGYRRVGATGLTCGPDGEWIGRPPRCDRDGEGCSPLFVSFGTTVYFLGFPRSCMLCRLPYFPCLCKE